MTPGDCQSRKIADSFMLTRVGITDIKKPITVSRNGRQVMLVADIDAFVDLPATQKGSHMSRNVEVITEMIESSVSGRVQSLEELCANICDHLLKRHEYASYAEVHISADYFLEKKTHSGKKTLEAYKLLARSTAKKNGDHRRMIGVEVTGMTACPCAMETTHQILGKNRTKKESRGDVPSITHNQRNRTQLLLEVPKKAFVEADDLIEIVESSMSSPTYGILKREDEAMVVIDAHRNPKFVEDVVREILSKILKQYDYLPDDVHVTVRSESEESIHKHNAFAERVTTLKELRNKT
ncbi:MAG TPA: GTP cyclohydrolase MptA [Thermoplasmata archaeon]|nr:GTP cyclohydrolase MptA [Thermoplasmata archaeon]